MSEQFRITAPQPAALVDQLPAQRSWRRVGVRGAIGAGLLVVAVTACNSNTENMPQPSSPGTTSSSPQTVQTETWPKDTWPSIGAEKVPFPGRVALPDESCKVWGLDEPQPIIARDGLLLAIVDARRSEPPQCDYLLDTGAGAYQGASYDSPKQKQSEREDDVYVKDGTVVNVTGYSIGEQACNDTGTSPIWIQFEQEIGGTKSMVPVINMGGSPTLDQLQDHKIPPILSPYEGKVHENC